jgi:hypothetical protein
MESGFACKGVGGRMVCAEALVCEVTLVTHCGIDGTWFFCVYR